MVLSGRAIKRGIEDGVIGIAPFFDNQIEAAHVNLHLGSVVGATGNGYVLEPKSFVVARTLERIRLPDSLCGIIEGRSKLAQQGLSVEQSSTFIEPGSDNDMVLEIFNASDRAIHLKIGQKIAKIVLFKITDEI